MLKAISLGLTLTGIAMGAFWVSGFDFDKRGEIALGAYMLAWMCLGIPCIVHMFSQHEKEWLKKINEKD